ncbi:MAG: hypothetical protein RIQ89_1679 [Bacteroidota bacterium]|jgi:arsenate reductase
MANYCVNFTNPFLFSTNMNIVKIYHLANCTTCQRIIKSLNLPPNAVLQDIKTEPISAPQLDGLKKMSGNYESLFSRVALKYRMLKLNEMTLTEKDYRKYILREYTFLKRPVIVVNERIFIGNAKSTIVLAQEALAVL